MRTSLSCLFSVALSASAAEQSASGKPAAVPQKVAAAEVGRFVGGFGRSAAAPPKEAVERPRVSCSAVGHILSLGAPPGTSYAAVQDPAGGPEAAARRFLKDHGKLFGVTSPSVDFSLRKKNTNRGRHSIRLTQTYDGIPVFGGEAVIQIGASGGVEYVGGSFDRDTSDLDEKRLSTRPTITARQASDAAKAAHAADAGKLPLAATEPKLHLYVPSLLKHSGPRSLVWITNVTSADNVSVAVQVLVDAHSGRIVQEISLLHEGQYPKNREIHTANYTNSLPGELLESEGYSYYEFSHILFPSETCYFYMGEIWDYYRNHFQRDGMFNDGKPEIATINYREYNEHTQSYNRYYNASFLPDRRQIIFGEDWEQSAGTVGHEYTHGVTHVESGLIYENESGAINESMSDVFAALFVIEHLNDKDPKGIRWDHSGAGRWEMKGDGYVLRNMATETLWVGSADYTTVGGDHGGVHYNSAINNKLCYLLTDGDTFRGRTVSGLGVDMVAPLYYEANTNLLTSSSGWHELAAALRQAAVNLNWDAGQRQNLERAMSAVGLISVYVDEGNTGPYEEGSRAAPAKNLTNGINMLDSLHDGRINIRGTVHASRITQPITIGRWGSDSDGDGRIVNQ